MKKVQGLQYVDLTVFCRCSPCFVSLLKIPVQCKEASLRYKGKSLNKILT